MIHGGVILAQGKATPPLVVASRVEIGACGRSGNDRALSRLSEPAEPANYDLSGGGGSLLEGVLKLSLKIVAYF